MQRSVPKVQTNDRILSQIQDFMGSAIADLQKVPTNDSVILNNVSLSVGSNTISHALGRKLLGWVIVRQRGYAMFYDTQDSNLIPDKTLQLVSDTAVVVDILCF